MKQTVAGLLLAMFVNVAVAQQPAPVFRDPHPGRTTAPEKMEGRAFGEPNPGGLTERERRCRRFARQLARVEEQQRNATTTGAQNQFGLKRQQLIEEQGRAGC
jgi:hypothetical protein